MVLVVVGRVLEGIRLSRLDVIQWGGHFLSWDVFRKFLIASVLVKGRGLEV